MSLDFSFQGTVSPGRNGPHTTEQDGVRVVDAEMFSPTAFPYNSLPVVDVNGTVALAYAKPLIRLDTTTLIDGAGAAGDPASLGTAALLIGQTIPSYKSAASRQAQHLLDDVPRWPNGAISHREDVAELWSDSIFMFPPFLAYYAFATKNLTIMREAVRQGSLYRDVLGISESGNTSAAGLWKHIVGPQTNDKGLWSTGNGWAAMGMMHVLAIAKHSGFGYFLCEEVSTLKSTIKDILNAAIRLDRAEPDEPFLRNYLNNTSWFGELSGTSLLAATAYRASELDPGTFGKEFVDWADEKRVAVEARINPVTGLLVHVVRLVPSVGMIELLLLNRLKAKVLESCYLLRGRGA